MSHKGKGKIAYALHTIYILPMLFLCMLIILIAHNRIHGLMQKEVESSLKNVSGNIIRMLDMAYPGDYHLRGDLALSLYKGDHDLTLQGQLLDSIRSDTGLDVTLFYQDTRILTTITDKEGERIIGTPAPNQVLQDVLTEGKACFYENAIIYGDTFFSYYTPLYNGDGSIVGMLFVGKSTGQITEDVSHCIIPLVAAVIIAFTIITALTVLFSSGFVNDLHKIRTFLRQVSDGDMSAKLDSSVLSRRDELRDIASSALRMQRSLLSMIEHDSLTQLYNRRYGERKLLEIINKSRQTDMPFTIVLGDIDHFKQINDTYGHSCGDRVLQTVSGILQKTMRQHGFAARWGGEEFLLVFDHESLHEAQAVVEHMLMEIRCTPTPHEELPVFVTMTFGMTPGGTDDMNALLKAVDEKLYNGKDQGRNRIVL
ncbi:MAG: diguanylate cyclase [Lachnospiraceae bacterium]|nr:diguanylate cyclase [Lachnospiraceae bacterium]